MELRHLVTGLDEIAGVPAVAAASENLVVSCRNGDVVVALASLGGALAGPVGVWLAIDEDYPAALAARDVATLSWLVEIEHVVVEGADALDAAAAVRALLSDDEVNLTNAAATLRGAYNRPSPPRAVTVWAREGQELRGEDRSLRVAAVAEAPIGTLTLYTD